jgi:hypothetical protein
MKKHHSFLLFSIFIFPYMTQLFSQNSSYGGEKFRFSVEFREKYDYMRIVEGMPGIGKRKPVITESKYFSYSLGVRLYKYLIAELGFHKETFELGWYVDNENDAILGYTSWPMDQAVVVPLRLTYEKQIFSLFKHPFFLAPSMAYSMCFSQGSKLGDYVTSTSIDGTTGLILYEELLQKGREFGFRRYYGLVEARLQADIMVSKVFSFYGGIGMAFGTHLIGKTNVSLFSGGLPSGKIITETKGDSRFFNVGIRLRIPNF